MDREHIARTLERLERVVERGRDRHEPRARSVERRVEVWPVNREEEAVLRHIGTYRSVECSEINPEIAHRLISHKLVEQIEHYNMQAGESVSVLTLTPSGRASIESLRSSHDQQQFWTGVSRKTELEHDLAISPAVRKEQEEIERSGGEVVRIKTDYEFRAEIGRERQRGKEQAEVAEAVHLPLIDGTVMIPDARIEYRDQDGKEQHVDVEVTTRSYGAASRAAKSRAGFKLHATKQRGRSPYED